MTQADSVHSTPPTNTSANNPPGEPDSLQDSLYLPTDVSPEELFQAIGRLRKDARDEIDRLIGFLNKTDDYVSRELEEAVDDVACDGDDDAEASLGWTEQEARGADMRGRPSSMPSSTTATMSRALQRSKTIRSCHTPRPATSEILFAMGQPGNTGIRPVRRGMGQR